MMPDVSTGFVFQMTGERKSWGPHSVIKIFFRPLSIPRPLKGSTVPLNGVSMIVVSFENLSTSESSSVESMFVTVESILNN